MQNSNLSIAARKEDTPEDIASRHRNAEAIRMVADECFLWPLSPSDPLVPSNCTELQRNAQRLQFWPDHDLWGPEQELPQYTSFFTDGSYSPRAATMADILSPESALRDTGYGSGAIVFFPVANEAPTSIRITSPHNEPGMNAYTWELVTQLIAMHLAKHLPPEVMGYSDCKAAISRTNRALKTKHDQLATTKAGIYGAAMHEMADVAHPRQFKWVKSHPETDPARADLHAHEDKGIFMADAVAEGDYRSLRARRLGETWTTLNFENILNEIIPVDLWHVRSTKGRRVPILDDLLSHQHDAQLAEYIMHRENTRSQDTDRTADYWSASRLSFAAKVHPVTNHSFWAAARRTLLIYDWIGHGRNRAKMCTNPSDKRQQRLCRHCRQPDSQKHCMLACPNPAFTRIRSEARIAQAKIATELMDNIGPHQKHFIRQICAGSWIKEGPHLERLWLGTWRPEMLASLILPPLESHLAGTTRHKYISLARQLSAPLLTAYRQIIDINVTQRDRAQGFRDYLPPEHDELEEPPRTELTLTHHHHLELAALHPQRDSDTNAPLPLTTDRLISTTGYSISDSTFRMAEDYNGG